jgi:hypothetical protein
MNRSIDFAMVSLLGIGILAFSFWFSSRYLDIMDTEVHSRAGHELKVVPTGYKVVWIASDRGLKELIEELGGETDVQSSISEKHAKGTGGR